MLKNRLNKHFASAAVVAAGVAGLGAAQADAAIVASGPVSIVIPDNIDGIYMNVVTGAASVTAGAAPGWDINPYSAVAGQFNLWGPTTTTWFPSDGVVGGNYNLAAGTSIGGASTAFFRPGGSLNVGAQFALNSSDNLFGFRFTNEAGSTVHFGWMRLAVGATAADRTIVEYAYEGVAETAIPAGAVPAPGALALLGAAGMLGARRRRN